MNATEQRCVFQLRLKSSHQSGINIEHCTNFAAPICHSGSLYGPASRRSFRLASNSIKKIVVHSQSKLHVKTRVERLAKASRSLRKHLTHSPHADFKMVALIEQGSLPPHTKRTRTFLMPHTNGLRKLYPMELGDAWARSGADRVAHLGWSISGAFSRRKVQDRQMAVKWQVRPTLCSGKNMYLIPLTTKCVHAVFRSGKIVLHETGERSLPERRMHSLKTDWHSRSSKSPFPHPLWKAPIAATTAAWKAVS